MGLEAAIAHGKERRQPYRDSRRFDPACRNHKYCPWCRRERQISRRRTEAAAKQEQQAYEDHHGG